MKRCTLYVWIVAACLSVFAVAQDDSISVRVITWNMQSDHKEGKVESDPDFLAKQMGEKGLVDIWGLSEVLDEPTLRLFEATIEEATGEGYEAFLSKKGDRDRLAILYRTSKFELLKEPFDLKRVMVRNRFLRPAFIAKLREKESGQAFFFAVNHFKCCNKTNVRVRQAEAFNSFLYEESLPVVAVGDYNIHTDVHNPDYTKKDLVALIGEEGSGPWYWIKPENFVPTLDKGSKIVDYVFVANKVYGWDAKSYVLKRAGNERLTVDTPFIDNEKTTDHRPVEAIFTIQIDQRREEILSEINSLEAKLEELKQELEHIK